MLPYLQAVTLKTYSEPFSPIDKYSGSFSNDDCDGNKNVKNEKGLGLVYMKKKSSRERGSPSQPSQPGYMSFEKKADFFVRSNSARLRSD